jgi:hypothetical protein
MLQVLAEEEEMKRLMNPGDHAAWVQKLLGGTMWVRD